MMFVLTVKDKVNCFQTTDVSKLKDIIRITTDNELIAVRIANIAENMLIGDVYHNHEVYLKCVIGESVR